MKSFKLVNNISGWIVFAIAAAVYIMTIEPTASFWDCGEFISTADKLEVGHPPGAPFFMLTARFFTLFASDQAHVAMMVNTFSALCSGLCILFLFWTITHLVRRGLVKDENDFSAGKIIAIIGSGVVGALAYTFSDTFWFSAVEGEVYAYSSLFTAVVFWAMLKWEDVADKPYANRWLVLIAYLMGLSIGVHLLNLLAVPVLALVYYYKKYEPTTKGTIYTLLISFVVLAFILYGLIPGFVLVAGWFELLFVNGFGFGFNVGTIFYAMLTVGCLVWGILETYKEGDETGNANKENSSKKSSIRTKLAFLLSITLLGIPFFGSHIFLGIILIIALGALLFYKSEWFNMAVLNLVLLCSAVVLLGYSSYATIIIRSAANTPMDQNSPDDVFALKSYLNRDQYGETPLLYGESYAAEYKRVKSDDGWTVDREVKEALYAKKIKSDSNEPDQYETYGNKEKYNYVDELCMFFPRMYSKQQSHIDAYKEWGQIKGRKVSYENMGQTQTTVAPTFGENLTFFFRYQVGFMYWRYFMWNFIGRQDDIQGNGEITHGNWLSGINAIDSLLLGDQSNLPDQVKSNKGRNTYFFLPLILGILGILYMLNGGKKGMQNFWLTFILFFMTGLAIVLYLNQTPYQPRERDYAYAGSFYAFCIWIGFGVMFLAKTFERVFKDKRIGATIATLICLPVPALMASQNWDDHDRSGRFTARDFGQNYLLSVAPNAIIFTNGDNDTFPLWYNQEVEGVRTDVRVANLSYLQMGWYVDQMKRQAYESKALPISLNPAQYSNGKLDVGYILNMIKDSITVSDAMTVLTSSDPRYKKLAGYGDDFDFIPTNKLYLPVDKAAAISSGTVQAKDSAKIVDNININLGSKRYLGKHEIVILDMLKNNNWERPIYYAVTVGDDSYLGMRNYFQLEGMAYRIVPINQGSRVNTDAMYDNMMNKFKWGGIENPQVYLDENNLRMTTTFRHMFSRLVSALIAENKKDSALAALDYCMKVIPSTTVPHSYVSVILAGQYLQLNQKEKAFAILDDLKKNSLQYLNWIANLKPSMRKSAMNDLEENLGIYSEVVRIEEKDADKETFEKDYQNLKRFSEIYNSYRR
ncbi:MAG TPA: DUF2723 domain-containing protein [Paludibacteraceae bacterium]|nr:DUF2723 domain-containing protein [Paludibacteraceae bacterium]